MSETKKNLTKELTKENLLKELPEMGKNLDAIRKGTNTELSADISMAEVVNERYGVSMDQYLSILGIDTKKDTLQNLFTMPDQSVRWVVPEIIRAAITLGLRQAPFYPNIIAGDQPVNGLQVTMPYINMSDAAPARVNEAETIPLGTISYGQKQVSIFKIGKGIKITDEVKNYVSLDVMGIFLRDFGIQLGYAMDNLAIDTGINGDKIDGSESAPVIGVGTTSEGIQYRDLLRIWIRGSRMGRNFTSMIGGEDEALNILDLPEFKVRSNGTTEATLNLHTPVPNRADFWIHGGIPANQLMLIDKAAGMIKLTAQPLMLESERIVSNQTEAMYASLTTGFSKMYRDAIVMLDSNKTFASNGFPNYMNLDPLMSVNLE